MTWHKIEGTVADMTSECVRNQTVLTMAINTQLCSRLREHSSPSSSPTVNNSMCQLQCHGVPLQRHPPCHHPPSCSDDTNVRILSNGWSTHVYNEVEGGSKVNTNNVHLRWCQAMFESQRMWECTHTHHHTSTRNRESRLKVILVRQDCQFLSGTDP